MPATLKPIRLLASLAAIGVATGALALGFAYTAGWLSPDQLTPERVVDALAQRGGDPTGHRRNHAKGVCFTGYFEASGAGERLSSAPMFAAGRYPVIGRFAIAVGNPLAADGTGRVRSMAIRVTSPDGQEWRSGMNNAPIFPVSNVKDFYDLTVAADIDPKTGKPDPTAIPRYAAAHPEFGGFAQWAKTTPWTSSYVDQSYYSVNAFRFVDHQGNSRPVRWAMTPTVDAQIVSDADRAQLPPDFLDRDIKERMQAGELRWTLVATLGNATDPTNDATKTWPDDREHVELGSLVVQAVQDEPDGPCRDYNYDPLILPAGIEPSDDPLLSARSAAYAESFDRRTSEEAQYPRTRPSKGTGQ